MSAYPAPSIGNSIQFNPANFQSEFDYITLSDADRRYLKISGGTISGNLTVLSNIDAASLSLSGASIDLNAITGVTAGTATANKALVLDSSLNITGINNFTAIGSITISSSVGGATFSSIAGTSTVALAHTLNGTALLGSTTSSAFGFRTAGVERVRILSNGNFGIGTSTAAYKLDVNGATNATSYYLNGVIVDMSPLSGITPGTAAASKALVLDASSNISGINSLSATSITVNGSAISSADLAYLSGIAPGTVIASKAVVADGNKDISSFRNVFATRFCTNTSYSNFAIDMGNAAGDRLLAVFDNGSAFYGLGANGARLQLHAASGGGVRMYTGSSVGATGTQIFDINSAGLMTCDSITLDTTITVPLANIRDNAQASGTRTEFMSLGRSSSGSDQGAWAFMNYYQTATQGDSNYFTFGPRLKTGLTTGWGMVMTQNGNVSFQDKNANAGAGGFKIQANIVGTVDIQGGITRTVGAGHGYLQANSGSPAAYNASSVSTRIGLWVENAIWTGDKVYASSDRRLKRDIEPIPLDEAKKLLNVQAVSYRWKKDTEDNMPEIGCIAQDLLEAGLAPLVSFCPNNDKENFQEGYQLGLQYSRLPIYMIELIKDLYAQIEELSDSSKLKKQPNVRKPLKRPNF